MSRLKKYSRNLATNYLQLGVNVVYSLVSIPLILHWLPKAEFGMWAVLVQLLTYVSVIDFGMTTAVARLLVDHKDERSNGNYGSLVKTAFWVSVTQGLIILAAVQIGAPILTGLMKIQTAYQHTFVTLLRVQGIITAFNFSIRPLGLMLEAYQRMDVLAYSKIIGLVAQLGFLILFLFQGCGIYSFIYANIIVALFVPCYLGWNCSRMHLLPHGQECGHASWKMFHEVFAFSRDVFLYNLGGQLIMSSQTIIVTRCLGLQAAAVWAVGTKIFNLCLQLLVRPLFLSMPVLSEMIVRQETQRLRSRFDELVVLTGSLGVYIGVSFALCNSIFIAIWTHNRIAWTPLNDVLLAAWLITLSFQMVHCNFCLVTKKMGAMRYIFFLEGCCFVLVAVSWSASWGIPAIILTSLSCTALFSFQYGIRRSLKLFHLSKRAGMTYWLLPSIKFALIYGASAAAFWRATVLLPPHYRFCLNFLMAAIPGTILFLRFGCPEQIIQEISGKLPRPASQCLLFIASHPK